jgi:hypothetical protein
MNRGHGTLFSCALIGGLVGLSSAKGAQPIAADQTVTSTSSKPIAVVELFTSEACPSCPPADKFLGELEQDARLKGEQIFPLAFHVDYRPQPGREDPLSSDQNRRRQDEYVQAMGVDGAYTPQMIVNGTQEFVGSDRETGEYKIKSALKQPAKVTVKVKARTTRGESKPIAVEYEVSNAPENAVINVALVEKKGTSIRSGRELINVVRVFKTLALKTTGKHSTELKSPASASPSSYSVVAYVQDEQTHAILGAAKADLSAGPPTIQAYMQERDETRFGSIEKE